MNTSSTRPPTSIETKSSRRTSPYIGRFAPSPSGPLHFGSLVTALASFLDAKSQQGTWLVRMENLDPPREEAGAQKRILESLQAHGLEWDGSVMYQGDRLSIYDEALASLNAHTFLCSCSRPRLLELRGIYDSHCHRYPVNLSDDILTSVRISLAALNEQQLSLAEHYTDLFQGKQTQSLQREVGDFILRRKDGLIAYQLAVVVDDIEQEITHSIRGSDLLSSTPRQRYLIQLLQGTIPTYGHLPVASNHLGQKLSKQHKAKGIEDKVAFDNLCKALDFLHHTPPNDIKKERDLQSLLQWSIGHWDRQHIPSAMSFAVEE